MLKRKQSNFKNMRLIFIYMLIWFASCSGKKQITNKETEQKDAPLKVETTTIGISENINMNDITEQAKDSLYDFTVSFWSPGDGIDFTTAKIFLDWLKTYGDDGKPQPYYEQVPWGREGETDFCIKLSSFSSGDKEVFLQEAKSILAKSKKVNYKENAPCKRRRQ
jgi:hypothetical protein